MDEKIQETVWESKIPLKLEMAQCDLVSSGAPLVLYVNIFSKYYISLVSQE